MDLGFKQKRFCGKNKLVPWSFYNSVDRRASEAGDIPVAHSASCGCAPAKAPKARAAGGINALIPNIPFVVFDPMFAQKR